MYMVKGICILDNDGKRLLAKVHGVHAGCGGM